MNDPTTIITPQEDFPPTAGVYSLLVTVSVLTITHVRDGLSHRPENLQREQAFYRKPNPLTANKPLLMVI